MNVNTLLNRTTSLFSYHDVNHDTWVVESQIKRTIENKAEIGELLSRFPGWDEEMQRVRFDLEINKQVDRQRLMNSAMKMHQATGHEFFDEFWTMAIVSPHQIEPVVNNHVYQLMVRVGVDRGIRIGMKLGKALRKVMVNVGEDMEFQEVSIFDKHLALFVEALKTTTVTETYYLSISYFDFMRMSVGNSWDSCHHIAGGGWRAGCLSYAGDCVTGILYRESGRNDSLISRAVVFFDDDKIWLSRVYGDSSTINGAMDLIAEQITTLTDNSHTVSERMLRGFTDTGLHYADYESHECMAYEYNHAILEYSASTRIIGSDARCLLCDDRFTDEEELACDTCISGLECERCGCNVSEDEVIYTEEDEILCHACAYYCEECGTYHSLEYVVDTPSGIMCMDCFNDKYTRCEHCGKLVQYDEDACVNDWGEILCPTCYAESLEEE